VSPSPVREFLSFRRTFMLLVLMVVLPSAGLSGFGIVAIVNERAAVEKRLELTWQGRLESVATALAEALASASMEPGPEGLTVLDATGARLSGTGFLIADGEVKTTDPSLGAALETVKPELDALPSRRAVFTLPGPGDPRVLATLREGDRLWGAELSLTALDTLAQALASAAGDAENAYFELRPIQRPAPETLVQRLVSEVAQARAVVTGPDGPQPLAERALPPPLQDVKVVALAAGEDPVALTATRNRVVYGILLGLFYVTLVVGVVLTGRTLYREVQLSRLKTDFVSQVSHELRTPLTSIRMFIETLALGRVRDEEQSRMVLGLLLQETERLSVLIERVLDWGRIENGRKGYVWENVEVSELVESAVTAFRAQRMDGAYVLEVEVAENLPKVTADREALSASLINLLQNAYKYSGEEKHLQVRARPEKRGVAIDVVDNGMGISAHERRKIFDRFYRVDNLLTRRNEGSGLGLSIARRIVEAHHGKITLVSHPGEGSTFTIHLRRTRGSTGHGQEAE